MSYEEVQQRVCALWELPWDDEALEKDESDYGWGSDDENDENFDDRESEGAETEMETEEAMDNNSNNFSSDDELPLAQLCTYAG